MLEDTARAHDFRYVALRYFNVAGADPKGRTGQSSPRATHLIKRGCQVALGRVPHLDIFGTDYPRPKTAPVCAITSTSPISWPRSCALALDYLRGGGPSVIMNCGYGHGSSVREVIQAIERVAGHKLPARESPRRPGDPPSLVADASLIRATLGWKPAHDNLDEIVRDAYGWEKTLNIAG